MPLTWEEAKETRRKVLTFLDTIDLTPYLAQFKGKEVRDMMDKLEEEHPYDDGYSLTLFDAMSQDSFVDYLNKRYSLRIRETCVYYI